MSSLEFEGPPGFTLAFGSVSGGSGSSGVAFATEAEALEGTRNDVVMSPLRTAQAIDAIPPVELPDPIPFATDAEAVAGTSATVMMSPHAVSAWYAALSIAMSKVVGLDAAIASLQAGQVGGNFAYALKATMDADLAHPAGATAVVYGDTPGNNGSYVKVGASGSGSWSRYSAETVVTLDARTSIIKQRDGEGFVLTDPAGAALMWVNTTAIVHPQITSLAAQVGAIGALASVVKVPPVPEGFAVTDPVGNALMWVLPTSIKHPQINALQAQVNNLLLGGADGGTGPDPSPIAAVAEHIHLMFDGQSNSVGTGAVVQTSAALSYADRFVGGVRPQDAGTDPAVIFGSLVPLVETLYSPTSLGETQAGGASRMIRQLLHDENGFDLGATGRQRLLCSNPGEPGMAIAALSTSPLVDRLLDNVTYGYARTTGATGKSYAVNAFIFNQGNADYGSTTRPSWLSQMLALRTTLKNQYQTVAGVDRPVPLFCVQTCSHPTYGRTTPTIALAQMDLQADDYSCLVAPDFLIGSTNWTPDGVHYLGPAQLLMGAYCGLALKRWLWDGVKPLPLRPVKAERYGTTTILKYRPVGSLVIDTGPNANPGNYGFSAINAAAASVTVTSVELVSSSEVAVRTATALPAGGAIHMGWVGDAYHGICCLRDSQGDIVSFEPTGLNLKLHRWQPIDELILT